ncbi:MAG: Coat domain protein [Clostridia bacterium]|jgi:spore coat protein CotF|nr:Coat domain protein [Clostridia bacterium]
MQLNTQSFGDKEMLNDALITEKALTADYNSYSNECANKKVRNALLQILNEEHEIQADVFNEMHARGFYPILSAEEQMINQAKQKFAAQANR